VTIYRNLGKAFHPESEQFKEAVHNSPVIFRLMQKLDCWLQGVDTKEGISYLGAPYYVMGTDNAFEEYFGTDEKKSRLVLNLLNILLENKVCQEMAINKGINETLSAICANENVETDTKDLSNVFIAAVKCLSILIENERFTNNFSDSVVAISNIILAIGKSPPDQNEVSNYNDQKVVATMVKIIRNLIKNDAMYIKVATRHANIASSICSRLNHPSTLNNLVGGSLVLPECAQTLRLLARRFEFAAVFDSGCIEEIAACIRNANRPNYPQI
jgi:hypothetical protein